MYTKADVGKCFADSYTRAANNEAIIRLALIEQTSSPAFAPRFPWAYAGETWPQCMQHKSITLLLHDTACAAIHYLNAACCEGVRFVQNPAGEIHIEELAQ